MNALFRVSRLAKANLPAVQSLRAYATEAAAASDKLALTFVLPHKALYNKVTVNQVNLAATSGDMGILANHVPTIEQLNPGIIEIIESAEVTKKFFVSGGFAIVNPDNTLNINAVEAAPLEEISAERVQSALAEAQRLAANATDDKTKAEANIQVQVYEAIQSALSK
ncbi:ATP synthase [Gongronella butleri]|nr:ATP synthase [Gongronella butleri]